MCSVSASVTLDADGEVAGEMRYYPFGEVRTSSGSMWTDQLFTGQRAMLDLGIYHYNARFYSPYLKRFLSADTVVPGAAQSQAYDRYAYVMNSPIIYADPTGHFWWVVAGFAVGAAISYGVQVYNNYSNGVSNPWTDVSAAEIIGGGLMGAGAVLCAPAVVGLAGDALVGTALVTGSTAFFNTGTSLYSTATIMEANILYGAPFRPLPELRYDPNKVPEIITNDYEQQAQGMPNTLTYSNDLGLRVKNSQTARSTLPSSSIYDRHEYPYASTYEGNYARANYVDPKQNASHGGTLSNFYQENAFTDGTKFLVNVGFWRYSSFAYPNLQSALIGAGYSSSGKGY